MQEKLREKFKTLDMSGIKLMKNTKQILIFKIMLIILGSNLCLYFIVEPENKIQENKFEHHYIVYGVMHTPFEMNKKVIVTDSQQKLLTRLTLDSVEPSEMPNLFKLTLKGSEDEIKKIMIHKKVNIYPDLKHFISEKKKSQKEYYELHF